MSYLPATLLLRLRETQGASRRTVPARLHGGSTGARERLGRAAADWDGSAGQPSRRPRLLAGPLDPSIALARLVGRAALRGGEPVGEHGSGVLDARPHLLRPGSVEAEPLQVVRTAAQGRQIAACHLVLAPQVTDHLASVTSAGTRAGELSAARHRGWTPCRWRRTLVGVDEGERARTAREDASRAAKALALMRRERELLHHAGRDTALLDAVLAHMEGVAASAADLAAMTAIAQVVQHDGRGPRRPEELAALTGYDLAAIHRALRAIRALRQPGRTDPSVGQSGGEPSGPS